MTSPTAELAGARIGVSITFVVFGLIVGSWLPHIPDAKAHIGCGDDGIGRALLCSGIGAIVSMQVVGRWIRRFGSRNVALAGAIGACLLAPGLMLQTTLAGFCANLFVLGLLYGALDVGMNANSVEVQKRFARPILSLIHGWFSAGGIVGGALASSASRVGMSPFAHVATTCSVLLVASIVGWSMSLRQDEPSADDGPKWVAPNGPILVIGLLCAAAFTIEGAALDWSALYVRETLGATPEFAGFAVGGASAGMTLGRVFGDAIVHRFGHRRVMVIGGAISVVGYGLVVLATTPTVAILGFALACVGCSNGAPILFNEAGSRSDLPTGAGIAVVTSCGYGAFLLGPPAIGLLSHQAGLRVAIMALTLLGVGTMLGARRLSDSGATT